MSIRMRLTLVYSAIILPILLILGAVVYMLLARSLIHAVDDRLNTVAASVERSIEVVDRFPLLQEWILPDVNVFASADTYVQVVDTNGMLVSKSLNLGNQILPVTQYTLRRAAQGQEGYETVQTDGVFLRIYTRPLMDGGQTIALLQVGGTLTSLRNTLVYMRLALLSAGVLSVVLIAAVGWMVARGALRPIEQITKMAAEIQEGEDLARRLEVPEVLDEVGQLVLTLNGMFARLEQAYSQLNEAHALQKQFASDASHELRTPLTSIKGNLELLSRAELSEEERQEVLQDLQSEVDRMIRLIQDLLALVRQDSDIQPPLQPVSVGDWLPPAIRQVSRLPRSEHVEFQVELDEEVLSLHMMANPDSLRQLLYILVENAFQYTPRGQVVLRVGADGGQLNLTVQDTGIGMEKDQMERVFQRFYRADPSRGRSGTGLGLAIAQGIVKQHSGRIRVSSQPGEGSCFQVQLPLLPVHPPRGYDKLVTEEGQ